MEAHNPASCKKIKPLAGLSISPNGRQEYHVAVITLTDPSRMKVANFIKQASWQYSSVA